MTMVLQIRFNLPGAFFNSVTLMILMAVMNTSAAYCQQVIVLRDLTLISDHTVKKFDEDGVALSNDQVLSWDQILKAKIGSEQAQFDQLVNEIGLPVYRLKLRIGSQDWERAGQIAIPMFENLISEFSDNTYRDDASTNKINIDYLVALTAMKTCLMQGDQGKAIVAFLIAAKLQNRADRSTLDLIGEHRLSPGEIEARFSSNVLPVLYSTIGLDKVAETINRLGSSQPGSSIYLAAIRLEQKEFDLASRAQSKLRQTKNQNILSWSNILDARQKQLQGEYAKANLILDDVIESKSTGRPLALYYRGLGTLEERPVAGGGIDADDARSRAMLDLLTIPTLFGQTHQSLSAAAIFQAAEVARLRNRPGDAQKLRDELLKRYPETYHGSLDSDQKSFNQ